MTSWWPVIEYPRPMPATGRRTTLVSGRYIRTKSKLTVVIPSSDRPRLRTSATALRNTSGSSTADQTSQIAPLLVNATGDVSSLGGLTQLGNIHFKGSDLKYSRY